MIDIYLNIYDIHPINCFFDNLGLGAYHTAIMIGNREYSFSRKKGIYYVHLDNTSNLKKSIYMGTINEEENNIINLISTYSDEFNEKTYCYLNNNCNHFTNSVLSSLFIKNIPDYINRLANFMSVISCFIPYEYFYSLQVTCVCEEYEIKITNLLTDLETDGPIYF